MVQLSAQNQPWGTVKTVEMGAVMSEVVVDVSGQELVAVITKVRAKRLGLTSGSSVTAVVNRGDAAARHSTELLFRDTSPRGRHST